MGIEIAVSVALPLWIGLYADKQYGSSPWGLLLGLLLGLFGLALNLYKVIVQLKRDQDKSTKIE